MDAELRALLQREGVLDALELHDDDRLEEVDACALPAVAPQGGMLRDFAKLTAAAVFTVFALCVEDAPAQAAPALGRGQVAAQARTIRCAGAEGVGCENGVVKLIGLRAAAHALTPCARVDDDDHGSAAFLDGSDPSRLAAVHLVGVVEELVFVRGGRISVIRVHRASQLDLSGVGAFPEEAPFAADVDVAALLGRESCDGWLRRLVEERGASDSALDRAESVGALMRLWAPTTAAEMAAVLDGAETPMDRARAWAHALDTREVEVLEARAARDLELFEDTLRALDDESLDGGTWDATRRLCRHRDALESIAAVLAVARPEGRLRGALARVDEHARGRLARFAVDEELRRDPQMLTVASAEPRAWWGAIVVAAR